MSRALRRKQNRSKRDEPIRLRAPSYVLRTALACTSGDIRSALGVGQNTAGVRSAIGPNPDPPPPGDVELDGVPADPPSLPTA